MPNARWPASNVVVLTEHTRADQLAVAGSAAVDLAEWRKTTRHSNE